MPVPRGETYQRLSPLRITIRDARTTAIPTEMAIPMSVFPISDFMVMPVHCVINGVNASNKYTINQDVNIVFNVLREPDLNIDHDHK